MNRAGGSRARWTGKPARVGASGDAAINYREALAWLYSLQRFGIKLGLENIERLLEELDQGSSAFASLAAPCKRSFLAKSSMSPAQTAKAPFAP